MLDGFTRKLLKGADSPRKSRQNQLQYKNEKWILETFAQSMKKLAGSACVGDSMGEIESVINYIDNSVALGIRGNYNVLFVNNGEIPMDDTIDLLHDIYYHKSLTRNYFYQIDELCELYELPENCNGCV